MCVAPTTHTSHVLNVNSDKNNEKVIHVSLEFKQFDI